MQVRTGDQGITMSITQADAQTGSDWDTRMLPGDIWGNF